MLKNSVKEISNWNRGRLQGICNLVAQEQGSVLSIRYAGTRETSMTSRSHHSDLSRVEEQLFGSPPHIELARMEHQLFGSSLPGRSFITPDEYASMQRELCLYRGPNEGKILRKIYTFQNPREFNTKTWCAMVTPERNGDACKIVFAQHTKDRLAHIIRMSTPFLPDYITLLDEKREIMLKEHSGTQPIETNILTVTITAPDVWTCTSSCPSRDETTIEHIRLQINLPSTDELSLGDLIKKRKDGYQRIQETSHSLGQKRYFTQPSAMHGKTQKTELNKEYYPASPLTPRFHPPAGNAGSSEGAGPSSYTPQLHPPAENARSNEGAGPSFATSQPAYFTSRSIIMDPGNPRSLEATRTLPAGPSSRAKQMLAAARKHNQSRD